MAKKRLMATLLVAVMLMAMLPVTIASAREVVLFDHTLNNEFEKGNLEANSYATFRNYPEWKAGNIWGTYYGTPGQLRDAEDGSLAVIRGYHPSGPPTTSETQIAKKILADTLTDNSSVSITWDFRTPDAPPQSASMEVWFRFKTISPDGTATTWSPMALKISGGGIVPVWAIMQFYPNGSKTVIGKTLDRDADQISFTWGKDYSVKITLRPNTDGSEYYRFVVDVWEDGTHIGTGVINNWSWITSDVIKTFDEVDFNMPTTKGITPGQEPDEMLFIKRIKVTANQPDAPLNPTYFPEDGCADATVDTEAYAEFESPVNDVSKSQVIVDGGASVADVAMENDNKRVKITLSGVKANTNYTIKLKDVKGKNAESAFDYEWSFTTDGGTDFKTPYFGSSEIVVEGEAKDIKVSDAVALTDEKYLNGEAWGTNNASLFETDDDYVWVKTGEGNAVFSKKFTPIQDGESLELSTVINMKLIGGSDTRALQGSFSIEGDGITRKLLRYHHNNFNQTVSLLYSDTNHGSYANIAEDTTVTTTGKATSGGAQYDVNKNSNIIFKGWPNPNTGKNTEFDGDLDVKLTMKPTTDGKYELSMTVKGIRIDTVSKCIITKAEAMALDTIALHGETFGTYDADCYFAFKNVKIEKTLGKPYPVVGENIVKIPYTNLSDADFDADVFVVERDAETGKLVKATIVNKEDISGENGELECTFEAVEKGNKIDFYVLNDADSMILLSGKTTFEVGE